MSTIAPVGECSPLLICDPYVTSKEWSEDRTESLQKYSQNFEIKSAAYLLRDAVLLSNSSSPYDYVDDYNRRLVSGVVDSRSDLCRRILCLPMVQMVTKISVYGLMLLSFFEPPSWCRDFPDGDDNQFDGCGAALASKGEPAFYIDDSEAREQDYYPNMGINFLTVSQAFSLEAIFSIVILIQTLLIFGRDGFFFKDFSSLNLNTLTMDNLRITYVVRIVRLIAILWLVLGLITAGLDSRPFAIFLRIILFITYSQITQQEIVTSIQMIPELVGVSFVLFLCTIFYAFVGVAAFYDTEEGTQFFPTLVDGMWTLFTSMTSVIYPDVMMPAYNENRFVALYFVSWMSLTYFFLLNVILAVVVNAYTENTKSRDDQFDETRKAYIHKAFQIIDKENLGYINQDQLMSIFLILNEECEEIRAIPEEEAEMLFSVLDKDKSETVDINEFENFGQVMLIEFEDYLAYAPLIERKFPILAESDRFKAFKDFIISSVFDYIIDIVIVLNTVVVIIQSYPELAGERTSTDTELNDGMIDTPWEVLETCFTILYCLEMASKILVLGWRQYTSSFRHLFDGFVTVLALSATLYVYYPNAYSNSRLIRYIVMTRVLRLFRLVLVMRPFRVIGKTFVTILPKVGRVLLLLFCVSYIFSGIGMYYFGGKLTRDPSNPLSYLLEGTDFAGAAFWANNFNDLLSGYNVVFNLLVVNNWNEFESGIYAVTQTRLCRYFFFFFYIVSVMIVNNLVIALVIDSFMDELDEIQNSDELLERKETKPMIVDSKAHPDKQESKRYVVNLISSNRSGRQKRKLLTKLFPQLS